MTTPDYPALIAEAQAKVDRLYAIVNSPQDSQTNRHKLGFARTELDQLRQASVAPPAPHRTEGKWSSLHPVEAQLVAMVHDRPATTRNSNEDRLNAMRREVGEPPLNVTGIIDQLCMRGILTLDAKNRVTVTTYGQGLV